MVNRLSLYATIYVFVAALQYPFSKEALAYTTPAAFMSIRYLAAAMIVFLMARRFSPIINKVTLLISFLTFMSALLWIYGLQIVSPAQSAVLSYTMPLFAIPLSVLILKEGTSKLGWGGALIGLAGVSVYSTTLTSAGSTTLGAILTVANAAFWGSYTVLLRKVKEQDLMLTTGTQFLVVGAFFLPLAPFGFEIAIKPGFIFDMAYVVLVGGVAAFFLWNSMARLDVIGRMTTLTFGVPLTTILFQALSTDEAPNTVSLFGVFLMFLGIYLSRIRRRINGSGEQEE